MKSQESRRNEQTSAWPSAVSRRSYRQPVASAGAAPGFPASCRQGDRRRGIRAAVRMQEEIGFEVVADGEFRRGSYWGRFVERTAGLEVRPALLKFRDDDGHEVDFTAPYAVSAMRRTRPLALDEFVFLRDTTRVTAKVTLPAPSTMHFLRFSDFAARGAYAG